MKLIGKATMAVALLGILGACAYTADIKTPPVSLAYTEGFDQSRLKAGATVAFRTYVIAQEGDSDEPTQVSGAKCQIKSKEFQAAIVTPALVELPGIKGKPSVMQVNCTGGDKKASLGIRPGRRQTIVVGDPITMIVGNIASAVVTDATDRWYYSNGDEPIRILLQ